MNEKLAGMPSSFVVPDPDTAWISSSMIRDLVHQGRIDDAGQMVPADVAAALQELTSPFAG